jgi:competence ComEA-like helix-hairpin-helix protein
MTIQSFSKILSFCSFFLAALTLLARSDPSIPSERLSEKKTSAVKEDSRTYLSRINVNQASLEELKSLPGIGESTARSILEYRKKNPPFRRVEELMIIKGISRNRLEKLRGLICVE